MARQTENRAFPIWSTLAGIAVFLVLTFYLFQFVPNPHCRDGWDSSSIGERGACSHHGGVRTYRHYYLLLSVFSLACAVSAANLLQAVSSRKRTNKSVATDTDKRTETPSYLQGNDLIQQAISQRKYIEFEYSTSDSKSTELREILPSRLTYFRSTLCVEGRCRKSKTAQSFAIHRMSKVRFIS